MSVEPDYRSVDLSAVADATADALDTRRRPAAGDVSFHGIPFRIAGDVEPWFVLLKPGGEAVDLPVDGRADRVIVAHRRLRRRGPEDEPVPGAVVARYVVSLADGTSEEVPIRERIEIAPAVDEGWDGSGAFAAAASNQMQLHDRYQDASERDRVRRHAGLVPLRLGASAPRNGDPEHPPRPRERAGRRRGDHARSRRRASVRTRGGPRGPDHRGRTARRPVGRGRPRRGRLRVPTPGRRRPDLPRRSHARLGRGCGRRQSARVRPRRRRAVGDRGRA
jgi:hypothetical protein